MFTNERWRATDDPSRAFESCGCVAGAAQAPSTAALDERRVPGKRWQLEEASGGLRRVAEEFIRERYREHFGADVARFMPRLFVMRDAANAVCGAFGLRAAVSRLFLETYLDRSIEQAIADHAGVETSRGAIVEVGHFCGTFAGAMRAMIVLLTEQLHREGYEWVAFAGTGSLRNAFVRIGLQPIAVCVADVGRLPPDERAAWGRYYAHGPRVYVGHIEWGARSLALVQVDQRESLA